MESFNPQGLHAEDIGNDPHDMTPSGLAEGDVMSQMLGTIVAPPAYVDPTNPAAAQGSVNLALEAHPLDIAEDYGDGIDSVAQAGTDSQSQVLYLDKGNSPEDVKDESEWTVADYKKALGEADLPTSGSKVELAERWAEHTAASAEEGDEENDDDSDNDDEQ